MASLNVWMNGELVGEWTNLRTGTPVFRYCKEWRQSPHVRALSLSLPITADNEIRGQVVENYFENLLPDSLEIRRRIRTIFAAKSMNAFDLLTSIGRDCVGAVQLLPPDTLPVGWARVEAIPLSETQVEQILTNITAPVLNYRPDDAVESFRISLAGAQEKTALLFMGKQWFRPLGATPTTHILKLPIGLIGGMRADFSDSVENEWLCAQLLRELGLPVATTDMATFGKQKVLVVTRFDRRWVGVESAAVQRRGFAPSTKTWIARLPQEDFCQAMGLPPNLKYEVDGGPSIESSLKLLTGSDSETTDKTVFILSQLAFWLLAATDGHGKNFSLQHLSAGHYRMTPLYDVLSVWPIIGSGGSQLPRRKARLAMALRGRSRHYKLDEIQPRHWQELARHTGIADLPKHMRALAESVDGALQRVEQILPAGFPGRLYEKIASETRAQALRFLQG